MTRKSYIYKKHRFVFTFLNHGNRLPGQVLQGRVELELELIQTQMAEKLMLRAEVYAHALRASQNVKRVEVLVGARCACF
jgi:hypothetical protein